MKILREHHVFERGEIGNEMELLKDEADFFGAEARKAGFIEARDVGAVDDGYARRRRIEPAENIDQRRLAGARRAHDGDPFAFFDVERNAVERAHVAKFFVEIFDLDERRHYSPRKITAGFIFPSSRSGSAPASATATISRIVSGNTSQRGEIAAANTRCPIQRESSRPSQASEHSADGAEHSDFGQKQANDAGNRAAERFHQADVFAALHRERGHRCENAQGGQHQDQQHGGDDQQSNAVQ